jgi:hypothetical protein
MTHFALAQDPYNKYMDFAPAFLKIPFMDTVFTDTHFGNKSTFFGSKIVIYMYIVVTRDRMGRMLAFVGRTLADSADSEIPVARGVGACLQHHRSDVVTH